MNEVIGGSFQGQKIKLTKKGMFIGDVEISKETVESFEIMNENINTTSFTKGSTKKSMIGAGTKGAVGAVIGTAIAPGIGTLIGAGAGVSTSKGKNKSVTKEVQSKEVLVGIFYSNGKQSLAKMDGLYYEKFLGRVFSEPMKIEPKENKQKNI